MKEFKAEIVKVERIEGSWRDHGMVTVKHFDIEATFRVPPHRLDSYRIGRTVIVRYELPTVDRRKR